MEGMNSSMIYLIYFKNICKCHNIPPHSITIKKNVLPGNSSLVEKSLANELNSCWLFRHFYLVVYNIKALTSFWDRFVADTKIQTGLRSPNNHFTVDNSKDHCVTKFSKSTKNCQNHHCQNSGKQSNVYNNQWKAEWKKKTT
jgi:hypothetical protein